ncbi:hypothetical protein ScPMuIL_009053 [Solemya velum]
MKVLDDINECGMAMMTPIVQLAAHVYKNQRSLDFEWTPTDHNECEHCSHPGLGLDLALVSITWSERTGLFGAVQRDFRKCKNFGVKKPAIALRLCSFKFGKCLVALYLPGVMTEGDRIKSRLMKPPKNHENM